MAQTPTKTQFPVKPYFSPLTIHSSYFIKYIYDWYIFFFLKEPSKQTCRNIDPTKEDLPEEGIYNQNANHEKNNRYFSTSKCLELLFFVVAFFVFKPQS